MATAYLRDAGPGVLYLYSVPRRPAEGIAWPVPLHSPVDIVLHGAEQFRSFAFWLGAEGLET